MEKYGLTGTFSSGDKIHDKSGNGRVRRGKRDKVEKRGEGRRRERERKKLKILKNNNPRDKKKKRRKRKCE